MSKEFQTREWVKEAEEEKEKLSPDAFQQKKEELFGLMEKIRKMLKKTSAADVFQMSLEIRSKIKEFFKKVPVEFVQDSSVHTSLEEVVILIYKNAWLSVEDASTVLDIGKFTKQEREATAKKAITRLLEEGKDCEASLIRDEIGLPDNFLKSAEAKQAATEGVKMILRKIPFDEDETEHIRTICQSYDLDRDIFFSTVKDTLLAYPYERPQGWQEFEGLLRCFLTFRLRLHDDAEVRKAGLDVLLKSWGYAYRSFMNFFNFSEVELDPIKRQIAIQHLQKGSFGPFRRLFYSLDESVPMLQEDEQFRIAAQEGIAACLKNGNKGNAKNIIDFFSFSPADIKGPAAIYFDASVPKEIREARETYAEGVEPKHQKARLTHGLTPAEFAAALKTNPDLENSKKPFEDAFDFLVRNYKEDPGYFRVSEGGDITHTVDLGELNKDLEEFAAMFGKEQTMRFLNRPDLSRHDILPVIGRLTNFLEINDILKIKTWGDKNPTQDSKKIQPFVQGVLAQVSMDQSSYDSGTSHHEFKRTIEELASLTKPVREVLERFSVSKIPALRTRAEKLLQERFFPLRSWRGLKDFAALLQMFAGSEIEQRLESGSYPQHLVDFTAALLVHPTISLSAVKKFLDHPRAFLDAKANFVAEETQRSMSPARLAEVERLGLRRVEVRDALTDGTLDRLQLIPEATREFYLDANGQDLASAACLREAAMRALGSREQKMIGQAKDVKTLFHTLKWWAKNHKPSFDFVKWLKGEIEVELSKESCEELKAHLYHATQGLALPEQVHLRVRIGRKSDADVVAAANDAANCMPFGDGKTNVFTWNPTSAQLVLERETPDGWRTMAQSVLTLDIQTNQAANKMLELLQSTTELHKALKPIDWASPWKLVCDNIEPSPNEISAGRASVIEGAYRKFFSDVMSELARALPIDPAEVIIGKEIYETGRPDWNFEKVPNRFFPLSAFSYLDNMGETSYRLPTGLAPQEKTGVKTAGIHDVTAADILSMAYLEGKGFSDNPQLIFGLFDRQNKIIAASIAREQNKDPNLMLLARDAKNQPVGYILAWIDRTREQEEIFLEDMAVDRSRNLASAKYAMQLLDHFLNQYKQSFGTTERPFIPIFAQMREDTSYKLFKDKGQQIFQKHGLVMGAKEEGTFEMGQETFHQIRMFIATTQEEVHKQMENFHPNAFRAVEHEDAIIEDEVEEEDGNENWEEEDESWPFG